MRYAERAPLCKGSCRAATEGLCGRILRLGKCAGEKVRGIDFAVVSSGFDGTPAKWGQFGFGAFGRWAHRKVRHDNPSVSFAASSPYSGEPLACTASARVPFKENHQISICGFAKGIPYSHSISSPLPDPTSLPNKIHKKSPSNPLPFL